MLSTPWLAAIDFALRSHILKNIGTNATIMVIILGKAIPNMEKTLHSIINFLIIFI
ncbi:hypothetical protein GW537_00475 [Piscirickettsia salmonis]|uniref:hypothetical protein n=1 Tax=Piscirickettsia salmonis TaxID=1238 RepID=UPI000A89257E|nr:hypothetical protein [Piscirickettsia salmonis]QHS27890.1 hypothetical protein GW537_00475 [Piscirickettsia salmonis]